ncbi:family 16 glycoside hydrolase [Colletotrichum sublineola]|nr:family 16 glycoside hydrolase [Colletotrichum sublineola]
MIWFNQVALFFGSSLLVADVLLVGAVETVPPVGNGLTIIPKTSFDSQDNFNSYWNYLYPWGSDHNGGARMTEDKVEIGNGTLTLTATKVSGQPPATHGGQQIAINYLSGTINAQQHFNVSLGGGYDFTAEVRATTTKGTWPAFWLTAVQGWPPEIDMAEWKGSGMISFNTFNTSSDVEAVNVEYPNPDSFHRIKCETRDLNGNDVQAKFYLDDQLVATQVGAGHRVSSSESRGSELQPLRYGSQ